MNHVSKTRGNIMMVWWYSNSEWAHERVFTLISFINYFDCGFFYESSRFPAHRRDNTIIMLIEAATLFKYESFKLNNSFGSSEQFIEIEIYNLEDHPCANQITARDVKNFLPNHVKTCFSLVYCNRNSFLWFIGSAMG